jgi:hypothetical protein
MRTISSFGSNVYSLYTIAIKLDKWQPVDRVTLYDTGEFYDSFTVRIKRNHYEIKANFRKEDGSIMDNLPTGTKVLGLTQNNLKEFVEYTLLPILTRLIRDYVKKA